MQQVIEVKPQEIAATAQQVSDPVRLIELAINQNADVEKLERLMDLQERWNKEQAKRSFYSAMARFQSDCPQIKKHKQGHNYKYAPLCDIVAQVKTLLSGCGLSYRFEQDHNNGIQVTCIVSHVDGHSERTSMIAMPDTSGSKNAVQAIGSTTQYLMRYTMIGALGITTADEDIDGRLPQEFATPVQEAIEYIPDQEFSAKFEGLANTIRKGKLADQMIIQIESKGRKLTNEQKVQLQGVQ